MKTLFKALFSTLFFIFSGNCLSQELIIPFQTIENKYVLFKLPLENSKDSITYFFDTGATVSLLDKDFAKKLNLKSNHKQEVAGASGKVTYEMLVGEKITVSKNEKIENVNFIFDDLTRLKKSLGRDFDGIIGNDILKNYITKIDFDKKQIILYKKNHKLNLNGYSEIVFQFKNNIPIPQFPITIELSDGTKYVGDIFFDSGASGVTLLMNTPFGIKNEVISKLPKSIKRSSNNLSGNSVSTTAEINNLTIADFTFNKLTFDISSDKSGVSSYKDYMGILGSEIINRFNIVLDYDAKKLYIKPNNFYNDKFDFPVSPIKIIETDKKITISGVVEGSDAERLGLKNGFQILSINNFKNKDVNFYRNLLKKEGKKIKIKYIDEKNDIKTVKLKLKRLL